MDSPWAFDVMTIAVPDPVVLVIAALVELLELNGYDARAIVVPDAVYVPSVTSHVVESKMQIGVDCPSPTMANDWNPVAAPARVNVPVPVVVVVSLHLSKIRIGHLVCEVDDYEQHKNSCNAQEQIAVIISSLRRHFSISSFVHG